MSTVYTYSFEDTSVVISHPSFGSYSAYGTGLGSVTVSKTNDVTTQDVASDAAVVISKHIKKNGTVAFEILQSSDFNSWLVKFTNYLEASATEEFARAVVTISNRSTGDSFTCTGVSHQKKPDRVYQSQAQNITWTFMAANIVEG